MNDWRSYDETAATYEHVWAPRFADISKDLVEMAAPSPDVRVLDVATGTGVTAAAVRAAAGNRSRVIGVDRSVGMLRAGQEARPGPRALVDVLDLPFADGAFDLVTCSFALHIFTKHETALFDMTRVLRPGGTIAVSVWTGGEDTFSAAWRELVEAAVGKDMLVTASADAAPGRDRFSDPNNLDAALGRAGIDKVEIEKREYRFRFTVDEYLEGLGATGRGRFVRQMLGEAGYAAFMERTAAEFRSRFADPLTDFNDALLAVGIKE
ncbi:MAG: methyltransferase domain-containing protein [Actinomycetota bacterium]